MEDFISDDTDEPHTTHPLRTALIATAVVFVIAAGGFYAPYLTAAFVAGCFVAIMWPPK